ncbi:MAG: MFS transporter [Eubacterium sp.]|nr:MFS transporter [Eubacterium sp.]
MFQDKRKRKQLICSYSVFILNGMLALSIGSMMPFIRDARGLAYALCGMLVSLHSVGNLISSFFAGAFAMKIGRKKTILLFNACFAIAYLLILLSGNTVCLMIAFLMTGLARGATSNFCNTVVNSLAPGKAGLINGLHAMFSIGAFFFPILLMLLTKSNAQNWVIACGFMLVMGILSLGLYALIPIDASWEGKKAKDEKEDNGTYGFVKEPIFYLTIITLFFYLCAEQGVIGWLVTYFKDTGLLNASLSQLMASIQWIMILAGRLTTAWLSSRVKKEKLLPVMGIGLVVFFAVLITSQSTVGIVIGIMGFGFSMAGIYPTTVSFSGNLIQKYPLAWSFILTLASLGSIIMPAVIGKIAESSGIVAGMSSVGAVVIIDFICIICLTWYLKKQHE